MKTIAFTGATGYVGYFVMQELLRLGAHVRVLTRSTPRKNSMQVAWIEGDLQNERALQTLVQGTDAVVHLAYQHVPGRFRGGEGDDLTGWLEANLHGSLRLLTAAHAADVAQFLFLSSRAVFSQTEPGRALDESHPVSPDTHYGAYKAAVEMMLQGFRAAEGMATTSVRATGIYGVIRPVERTKWWELIQLARSKDAVEIGKLSGRGGTEVHGRDVARTVAALLESGTTAPAVVHLSDLYVTQRQIVQAAYRALGEDGPLPPLSPVPPSNVLVCNNLARLGITLGGEALLQATIDELVREAARHAAL